jgi:Outer membrane protein beta-barrel domain
MKQKFINRKTILLFITLFSLSSLFAQRVTPGIRAGANLSNWNINGGGDAQPVSFTTPDFGIFTNITISKAFSIEPGVSYTTMGAALKYENVDKVTYKLNYIQLPILARYSLPNGLSFSGGLQPGFLLKANGKDKFGDKSSVKNSFTNTDFSIVTGVQYNFPFGIGVGAKYIAGLNNIFKIDDVEIRNYSFGLQLSYQFQPAKRK